MKISTHIVNEIRIAEITTDEVIVRTAEDVLDILGNIYYQDTDRVIIQQKNFSPAFFDLKSGLAGDVLQKFSNYRIRLAIVGDFTPFTGKSIRDFIYESNQHRQVNFLPSAKEALEVLSGK